MITLSPTLPEGGGVVEALLVVFVGVLIFLIIKAIRGLLFG